MRIALVDTTRSTHNSPRMYPIALLKIGAYLKDQGNECELFMSRLPVAGEYDEIWISTLFTYDIPFALGVINEALNRAPVVLVGGIAATLIPEPFRKTGAYVCVGQHLAAENHVGDYSLLPEKPRYSIVYTSRGCIRNCGFCMVRELEPHYKDIPDWERQIIPGTREILFYDNNWLAKSTDLLRRDINMLRPYLGRGKIVSVDFNQALDARLMTPEKAALLEGIPIKPVRFAFDWLEEDGYYQEAIKLMAARGHREFLALMLYNYTDTPADFYYRLRENARLTKELGVQVKGVPMKYHPVKDAWSRDFIGEHWTRVELAAFGRILAAHSTYGQVSCLGGYSMTPIEEFQYWFGKDAAEFTRRLSYPKIRQLIKRKKTVLRHYRSICRGNSPAGISRGRNGGIKRTPSGTTA